MRIEEDIMDIYMSAQAMKITPKEFTERMTEAFRLWSIAWAKKIYTYKCHWCGELLVKRYDKLNFQELTDGYHENCLELKKMSVQK